ncbi:hypothetical protein [Actinomycetospora sp. NBC_00405]|uniref:hypothetical protein n=1 Tax=Actinomycetospora sp. NBC_00405 TaxID=2975952 RepID=UPI002E2037A1
MTTSPTTPTSGADLVTRLLDLWSRPLPADDTAALAEFGELYSDPVDVRSSTS